MELIKLFFHNIIIYIMNLLSKIPLLIMIIFRLHVRYRNVRDVYSTRGPYLMLPNHTNQWDPFIISWVTPRPIRWVASDGAFRDSVKTLMIMGGAIPKVKDQSDMMTLQEVKKAMFLRHAAGIFPEGAQNWDGKMLDLIPATAKLVRFLKVPVIVPLVKGGYLTKPRWAWGIRPCRIEIEFRRIIDSEEIKTLKLAEIERRMHEALDYDEYDWQEEAMVPIRSEKRAEHMELAHFACPSCEAVGTMRSEGNSLFCECGYRVEVDRYGFLEYPENGPSFARPHDWVTWQNALLVDRIREALDSGEEDPVLLRDADITLMRGERAMPMRPVNRGEARLYRDRIEIGDIGEKTVSIPLKETTAANTFKQQKFEFRFEKVQYRFGMPNRSVSGYKWEVAYKGLRDILVDRGQW